MTDMKQARHSLGKIEVEKTLKTATARRFSIAVRKFEAFQPNLRSSVCQDSSPCLSFLREQFWGNYMLTGLAASELGSSLISLLSLSGYLILYTRWKSPWSPILGPEVREEAPRLHTLIH